LKSIKSISARSRIKECDRLKRSIKRVLVSMALVGLILSASCTSSKTPTITTSSLPEGTEGVTYSETLIARGGTPPYIWSTMGGELPIGLQLNPTSGVISGTPIIASNPSFVTFMATDNLKKIAFKQILMTVNPTTTATSTFSSTTTTATANSASVNSISGLSLSLSLDAANYKPGQDVYVTIEEHNTLNTDTVVPASNNWALDYLAMGGCGTNGDFVGIALFQGYYTASNKSFGEPLLFWNYNITTPCPTTTTPPNGFDFTPLDHKYADLDLKGYWTGNSRSAIFTNFKPGIYTVVAGDEWGALVFVHFTVKN